MADCEARRQYVRLLRDLVRGAITTDAFGYDAMLVAEGSDDEALKTAHEYLDSLCGDLWSYRLRGKRRLSRATRKRVAQCILFLQSGEETFAPDPGAPAPSIGLADLCVGLAVFAMLLFLAASWGAVGLVVWVAVVAVWLWSLHLRDLRAAEANELAWSRAAFWPFQDDVRYRRAVSRPFYLSGRSAEQ